ncbi:MAG: hypothetical protein ACRDQ5_21565, partial [Sciscionella sp.]
MTEQTPTSLYRRRPPDELPPKHLTTRILNDYDSFVTLASSASDLQEEQILLRLKDTSLLTEKELFTIRTTLSTTSNEREEPSFNIVFDTGATVAVTPNCADFISPMTSPPNNLVLRGISSGLPVQGVGTIRWYVVDDNKQMKMIETEAFYVPEIPVRLVSPQSYMSGKSACNFTIFDNYSIFTWENGSTMTLPYHPRSRLPIAHGYSKEDTTEKIFACVTEENNQNLTAAQKVLLRWHFRLGHPGFEHVQWLARQRHLGGPAHAIANCERPKCASCQYGSAHRRPVGRSSTFHHPKSKGGAGSIKADDLRPGQRISVDQYESRYKGRLRTSKGKTKEFEMYCGGTIFCDHASSLIDVRHQVSFGAHDTIRSKNLFERMAMSSGVFIDNYHSDNGVFSSSEFRRHLESLQQGQTLSGVGAHHQNGVAERAIKTVVTRARTLMLHAAIRWPETADVTLWPMALNYAVHLWNVTPRESCGGLAPIEIFTSSRFDHPILQGTHVWGCPTYVLDPTLQDGKKIPKWRPRSRRGMFVGISPDHSTTVSDVLNLTTLSITPQY